MLLRFVNLIYIVSLQPDSLSFLVRWFSDIESEYQVSKDPRFKPHLCQF